MAIKKSNNDCGCGKSVKPTSPAMKKNNIKKIITKK